MKRFERIPAFQFLQFRGAELILPVRSQIDRLHSREIFLFRELLVFKAVRLLAETDAEKTVLASAAVTQKEPRPAVDAILTPDKTVAPVTVDRVMAEFAVVVVVHVHAGFAVLDAISVHAILIMVGMHDEVTIFAITCQMYVFRVFVGSLDTECRSRRRTFQFFPLVKK